MGMGRASAQANTGHSLKRGGVQLFRLLGAKDSQIKQWFGMTGNGAYPRYTEGLKYLGGADAPAFHSIEGLRSHSDALTRVNRPLEEEDINGMFHWPIDE